VWCVCVLQERFIVIGLGNAGETVCVFEVNR